MTGWLAGQLHDDSRSTRFIAPPFSSSLHIVDYCAFLSSLSFSHNIIFEYFYYFANFSLLQIFLVMIVKIKKQLNRITECCQSVPEMARDQSKVKSLGGAGEPPTLLCPCDFAPKVTTDMLIKLKRMLLKIGVICFNKYFSIPQNFSRARILSHERISQQLSEDEPNQH